MHIGKAAFFTAVLLLAGIFPAGAQHLTTREISLLDSCADNTGRKVFSPVKAGDCLKELAADNYNLLNRARASDPAGTAELLSGLEAIKDLDYVFSSTIPVDSLRAAVKVRLEADPCVLCAMQLGPQPDKLYPWVERYEKWRLRDALEAGLDWEYIPPQAASYLAARPSLRSGWPGFTISRREKALSIWATAELDRLLAHGAAGLDIDQNIETLRKMWPFLSEEQRGRVMAAIEGAGTAAAAARAQGERSAKDSEAGAERLEKARTMLAGLSDEEAADYLAKAFDDGGSYGGQVRVGAGGGGLAPAASSGGYGADAALSDADALAVSTRLLTALTGPDGELAGTQIGRETMAFMAAPGGKINFALERLASPGIRGVFRPDKSEVRLNISDVETAMLRTGVTRAQLLDPADKEAMAKIARYVAPVFVHEYYGHQKQSVWAAKENIPDLYYLGQETESFSKGALFVLQKMEAEEAMGNAGYIHQIAKEDLKMALLLRDEGPAGVGRYVMYYNVNSRRGKAAENFALYGSIRAALAGRARAAAEDPAAEAARDAKRPAGSQTKDLEQRLGTFYPWYEAAGRKSEEDFRYFQAALRELDAKPGG